MISATTRVGKHTPKLTEALANGTRHAVELVDGARSWTGKNGLLLSYQTHDQGEEPLESWAVRMDVPAPGPSP